MIPIIGFASLSLSDAFYGDPEKLQRARELNFEPPLDEGIREIVVTLIAHGVETYESCEGGEGHSYPEPTVRFEGDLSEGLRVASVALGYGLQPFLYQKGACRYLSRLIYQSRARR